MTNDKHLIESVTNKQGQVITVNLLVDDENWFEVLEEVETRLDAIYVRANHETIVDGNHAKAKDGSWVEYVELLDKDEVMKIVENIDGEKLRVLCKACLRNGILTTVFEQTFLIIETYAEGYYLKFLGTRSGANIFLTKDLKVIRKPIGIKLLNTRWFSVENHDSWSKIEKRYAG